MRSRKWTRKQKQRVYSGLISPTRVSPEKGLVNYGEDRLAIGTPCDSISLILRSLRPERASAVPTFTEVHVRNLSPEGTGGLCPGLHGAKLRRILGELLPRRGYRIQA